MIWKKPHTRDFFACNSRPKMAAPIYGRLVFLLFLLEDLYAHKIPYFRSQQKLGTPETEQLPELLL